ncbi:MAG: hypothetical protein ACTSPB_05135 [Candidatus Thorarchaeota archaeon]
MDAVDAFAVVVIVVIAGTLVFSILECRKVQYENVTVVGYEHHSFGPDYLTIRLQDGTIVVKKMTFTPSEVPINVSVDILKSGKIVRR